MNDTGSANASPNYLFDNYSSFNETVDPRDLQGQTLLDFYEPSLVRPRPEFVLYQTSTISALKTWVSTSILAESPRNVVAMNGFTKTGKSTLARCVLPSVLKMLL
jgi:hypothetical protein